MDATAQGRWESKLVQHRELRRAIYEKHDKNSLPMDVFEGVAQYNGGLLHIWMEIFSAYWNRVKPSTPQQFADKAKKEVEEFIEKERQDILGEIRGLWIGKFENEFSRGERRLGQSCDALKHKCFELIANLEADEGHRIRKEGRDRRWQVFSSLLSLASGGLIAFFSVFLTNKSNRENLEPFLELSFGKGDSIGRVEIIDDVLNLEIENIGPNMVKDVQIDFGTFRSDFGMREIKMESQSIRPTFEIPMLRPGEREKITFGRDDRYKWENVFKGRGNASDEKSILFCRVHARYRRGVDGKIFHTTRLFLAYRNVLVPWRFPIDRDNFISGYER